MRIYKWKLIFLSTFNMVSLHKQCGVWVFRLIGRLLFKPLYPLQLSSFFIYTISIAMEIYIKTWKLICRNVYIFYDIYISPLQLNSFLIYTIFIALNIHIYKAWKPIWRNVYIFMMFYPILASSNNIFVKF